MDNVQLLLRIVRGLRYETLHPLIGTEVTIGCGTAIFDSIAALAEQHGDFVLERPEDVSATNGELSGPLVKYGLIDFEVRHDATIESTPTENAQRLRDFGFAPRLDEEELSLLSDDDEEDYFLGELHEEIAQDGTWLKLFLRVLDKEFLDSRPERARRGVPYRAEEIPFPLRFRVVDACLTNAPTIWFHRHFYM